MDIHVYTFEDATGAVFGSFSTQNYEEAKTYAAGSNLRVIDNTYTWSDSEMVDDFTSTD